MVEAVLILSVFGGVTIIFLWSQSRRRRRIRYQHLQSHPEMSDADFLAAVNVPTSTRDAACRVRRALAKAMKVPAASLHPSDDISYVASFGLDNMDLIEIVVNVEDEVGCHIPSGIMEEFWQRKERRDVAALIDFLFSCGWRFYSTTFTSVPIGSIVIAISSPLASVNVSAGTTPVPVSSMGPSLKDNSR
jgi:acyl carrier protein